MKLRRTPTFKMCNFRRKLVKLRRIRFYENGPFPESVWSSIDKNRLADCAGTPLTELLGRLWYAWGLTLSTPDWPESSTVCLLLTRSTSSVSRLLLTSRDARICSATLGVLISYRRYVYLRKEIEIERSECNDKTRTSRCNANAGDKDRQEKNEDD